MTNNAVQNRKQDARHAPRTSIYLSATLYCDGAAVPVRVRNISETGALIESTAIPGDVALVQLVRGELIVHALVAWRHEERCGLKFSGRIDVQRWRSLRTNTDQQRVDEIVKVIKAGAVPLPIPLAEAGCRTAAGATASQDLATDLQCALDLLGSLGNELASEAETIIRHGSSLQTLDIAIQVVAAVKAIMGGDGELAIDANKLTGLRRSADQALQRGSV